jgi:hypothetical protein
MQITYDATDRVSFVLNLANVINQCFGGTKAPWTGIATPKTCSYINGGLIGLVAPVGNAYNPGVALQPIVQYPYFPFFGPYNPNVNGGLNGPFSAFLSARVKL